MAISMNAALLLVFMLLGFTACKKDNASASGKGTVQVRMTDAPGAYDAVNIDVTGVQVHSDVSGWVPMNNVHAGIYNLLDLTNGIDTLIATQDMPEGTISQIRLLLGSNNTVVIAGNSYPLTIPSGSESGLKINVHDSVKTGVTTTVLLDFNAGASVHETGNGYQLKPVIHAIVTTAATGSISGVISPAVFANIYVVAGTDTIGTTPGLGGQFMIQAVPVGTYNLVVDVLPPLNDLVLPNIVVAAGQTTDVGLVNL